MKAISFNANAYVIKQKLTVSHYQFRIGNMQDLWLGIYLGENRKYVEHNNLGYIYSSISREYSISQI